jgi:RluA family pseudouridine synthase
VLTDSELAGSILWADEDLVVINKPSGLPTLPDGYDPDRPHVKSQYAPILGDLWIVHRLDRETSGVLAIARNPSAHKSLNDQFAGRSVFKVYLAIVVGSPNWQEKEVDYPLRPDGDRRHRTVVDRQMGKPARTLFKVLERYRGYTLIEALPQTGRTHQIRAHIAVAGYAIAGDNLYGSHKGIYLSQIKPGYRGKKSGERPLLGRLGLHAQALTIMHPRTGMSINFEAPFPKDIAAVVRQLRKHC